MLMPLFAQTLVHLGKVGLGGGGATELETQPTPLQKKFGEPRKGAEWGAMPE